MKLPVSVVIATLGHGVLRHTIQRLNIGQRVPAEILICIPNEEGEAIDEPPWFENVRIIRTSYRGQVAQRAAGLRLAQYPYVLQLDDDVILQRDTVELLLETLVRLGPGNIVAPFFRLYPTGREGTRYPRDLSGLIRNFYASLVCGAPFGNGRMGKISPSGHGYGVAMSSSGNRVIESDWLPGGVALCHKVDIIVEDYYPFAGKAYSEDLIHSIIWRKQGCRLWTLLDVSVMIDVVDESFAWSAVIGRYKGHAYVTKLSGGELWRTRLWLFVYCLINLKRIIVQNISKN